MSTCLEGGPHHWLLGKSGKGVCRKCHEEKQFDLFIPGAVHLGYGPRKTGLSQEEAERFHQYLDEQAEEVPE